MKSILTVILSIVILSILSADIEAQILFSEDFSNGMPASFKLFNRDSLIPNPGVYYVTDAWIARPDFDNPADSVACSTSWYTPPGTSDDWMVTPAITISGYSELSWDAKAQDPAFPDGYQVYISADSTPDQFLVAAPLFLVDSENGTWTHHKLNLSIFSGQHIHIAFRNNSTDKFLLLVDNIQVYDVPAIDGGIALIQKINSGCTLSSTTPVEITIVNYGGTPLFNFPLSYNLNNGTPVTETYIDTIQPGDTASYTFVTTADLSAPGTYNIIASTSILSDSIVTNDTASIIVNSIAPDNLSTSLQQGFESGNNLNGWHIGDDVNADDSTWAIVNNTHYSGAAHTGTQAIRLGVGVGGDDDWTYSTCLDLVTGIAYSLDFWYRKTDSAAAVSANLSAYLGNAQNAAAMTQAITNTFQAPDTIYLESVTPFSVATSGTYYVGLHGESAGADVATFIDDINISIILGTHQIDNNANLVSVYPSPANSVLNIKLDPSLYNAHIDVYNSIGAFVSTISHVKGGAKLDVSAYAKGIYMMIIRNGAQTITKRFLVAD